MRPDLEPYRKRAAEVLGEAYKLAQQRKTTLEIAAVNSIVRAAEMGRYEVQDSNNYLGAARERVLSGDSVIFYFGPHIEGIPPDIGTLANVTTSVVPQERTAIYTAKKHLDPNRGTGRIGQGLHRAEVRIIEQARSTHGFTAIEVIHTAQEVDYYSKHRDVINNLSPNRFNIEAVNTAAEFLLAGNQTDGGNALIIAPGGSRDPKAKLTQAHIGLEFTLQKARTNTFVIGLALEPNVRKTIPVFGKLMVRPTMPLDWEIVNDTYIRLQQEAQLKGRKLGITRSDLMMIPLATLLSPRYQGYYGPLLQRFPHLADPENWANI